MYKIYIDKEKDKFFEAQPEMTYGQLWHTTITSRDTKETPLEWLFNVSDEDLFTAMSNALEKESDE
jgi:hypothetical protein